MKAYFIQESKQCNKYRFFLDKMFSKIRVKEIEGKTILELPMKKDTKLSNKKARKIVESLLKYNVKMVAISRELKDNEILKSELYSNNIKIIDGKYLFRLLMEQSIKYICTKSKRKLEDTSISILTNDYNKLNEMMILKLARETKTLNIITNHIDKFENLEEYLYNEQGIVIRLSNNKKVALLKSNIIINLDFPKEAVNEYLLPNKCVIVNAGNNVKIESKRFNGINVKDYIISIPEKYKMKNFEDKIVYENIILNMSKEAAEKQILEDKIQIKKLIGEKGIINEKEFRNME